MYFHNIIQCPLKNNIKFLELFYYFDIEVPGVYFLIVIKQ